MASRLTNTDQLKKEIEEALPISAVAERLCDVDLQRSGTQWQGLCPLHEERTPSFNANDSKGVYHCFGCFVAGTMVLTAVGYRPIENIQEGDLVVTHTGSLKPVKKTMQRLASSTRIVRVVGSTLQTTEEHPFFVRTNIGREKLPGGRRGRRVLSVPEWIETDSLGCSHLVGQIAPDHTPAPTLPVPPDQAIDFLWVVGRYLADGWRCLAQPSAGNPRSLVICCHHNESEYLGERLRRLAHVTESRRRTTTEFTICRKEWFDWLAPFGDKAYGKLIPVWVYGLRHGLQSALLDGYLSGDGSRSDDAHTRGWRARSVSKALTLGIALLGQTARGVVAGVSAVTLAPTNMIEGRVVNQSPAWVVTIPDKNSRPVVDGQYGWKPIHSIENAPGANVYNLEVADDNSYVVENVIVHNCKEGGDAIDLIRKARHLEYIEALYLLAAEADVEIEKYERPMTPREKEAEELRAYSETWLGQIDYTNWRVPATVAREFGSGQSPQQRRVAPPWFHSKDYLLEGYIFPYRLPNGRLVGWKTRHSDDKQFGTPADFPLHEETLYGIQIAREHMEHGAMVAVEGEFDCMTAHYWGIRNVVAMGGSTITAGQMELLDSLHVRAITVVLDGDDAGRKAARSIAERHWAQKISVRIAVCPDGMDPDEAIPKFGQLWFEGLVKDAKHALEYLLWLEWTDRPRTSLSDKLDFVGWIQENYGAKLRTTDASLVLKEVAKWLGVPEVEVQDFVRSTDTSLQAVDSERVLLGQAVRDSKFYVGLRRGMTVNDFYLVKHQRVWDVLARMLVEGLSFDVATIARYAESEGISASFVEELAAINSANYEYHEGQVLDMALRRSARDDAIEFKNKIADTSQSADLVVGELTHRITERALRKTGAQVRQLNDQVDEAMDVLHTRMKNPSEIHGLDLGAQFPETSKILQGLQPRRFVLLAATSGVGKALAVDTPIPTPNGWVAMGDLSEGDIVFDEKGFKCSVIRAFPIMDDRLCYRVTFSDDTMIVADAEHEWWGKNRSNNAKSTWTTDYMSRMGPFMPNGKARFIVPVAGALDCESLDLPLDPYVLGAWLGDGHNVGARLFTNKDECGFFGDQIRAAGVAVTQTVSTPGNVESNGARTVHFQGNVALKAAGVWGDKHIPLSYLRSSRKQRLALLQGLMDTDGHIGKNGRSEYVTKSAWLRDGVVELVRSLGLKPTCYEKMVKPCDSSNVAKWGIRQEYGPYFRVSFFSYAEEPVVRMPHKVANLKKRPSDSPMSTTRRVIEIEPVESVPVRCIQVDSPNHLYLAGDGMVPTHNSTLMIQIATSLSVHQSIPTDIVSLEMDELEVLNKMASHMTAIDSMAISGGTLDAQQARKVERAMAQIRQSPIHIWAPDGLNSIEFMLYARESVMQRKTEAFFVDYIQLTDPDPGMERDNGYTQYGHFGRMAKMKVARAMEVAVVCCAQLTRNAASKERPTKEDMGDSYALVRHADVILILAGDAESPTTDLWVEKNRQGVGNMLKPLVHLRPMNTFYEASTGTREPEYVVKLGD